MFVNICSFVLSFFRSFCFILSFICLFIHSFTHSLTHPPTHPPIHSFIHSSLPSLLDCFLVSILFPVPQNFPLCKQTLWENIIFHVNLYFMWTLYVSCLPPTYNLNFTLLFVSRRFISYGQEVQKWCIPFLGADPSVVRRSQRHSVEVRNKKPIQYGAYVTMPSLIVILLFMFCGFFFVLLCQFKMGRYLLEKVSFTGLTIIYSVFLIHVVKGIMWFLSCVA